MSGPKRPNLSKAWPYIWKLIRPRSAILLLGLLLMAINRTAGLVLPYSTRYLIDKVIDGHQINWLAPIVGTVLAATALQAVTSYSLTQLLSKEAQRLINELRQNVHAHVTQLPVSFYDANKTGALVSRIMSDVEGVRNLVGSGLVNFLGGILTAVLALGILLRYSTAMTLVALGFVAGFMLATRKAFSVIRPVFRERRKITAEVTGRLTESLGGVRVVKGYHAEEREAGVFAAGLRRLLDNVFRTITAMSLMGLSAMVMTGTVGACIMWMGAHRVLNHTMTLGELMSFTSFLAYLVAPVVQVVDIGSQLTEAVAGLERTQELMEIKPEDVDPKRTVTMGPIEGDIRFENVDFAYETGPKVLHDITFDSAPGAVTALVGPSGSGKSTIIGLLAAFYTPSAGTVSVDGVDLSTVRLGSYRSQLGMVLQESFLFDGTIRENVKFGRPDADEEEFLHACRIARVDEFAERFKDTYDTVVGERGVKLSGGQRQRLSIARAILANPRILILDEATSSLDSESEALIQEGLQFLLRDRTTFVIAHRLSTIRAARQIVVVEGGRIVERGNHEELLLRGGRYFELYMRQQGLEKNRFLAPGEGDKVEENASTAAATRTEEPPPIRFFS